jgi:hypothetical protein
VDDSELEELIDQRTNVLIKSMEVADNIGGKPQRGQIAGTIFCISPLPPFQKPFRHSEVNRIRAYTVEFYERRPKKNWFSKAEEKVCWEQWVLNVTLVSPRADSGA